MSGRESDIRRVPGIVGPERRWTGLSRDAADALAALIRSSNDAIYSKDSNAFIRTWNPAAERLYGWTAEEAVGQNIKMIIPNSRSGEEIDFLERVFKGERVEHYETERLRKDGSIVKVSVSISPVHDLLGNVVEASVIARDITAQSGVEELLAQRNHQQALELNDEIVHALEAAKIALERGEHQQGLETLTATLGRLKEITTALMSEAEPKA